MDRKYIRLIFLVASLWSIWGIADILFIGEWRAERAHASIKESIVKNYHENEAVFDSLILFVNELDFDGGVQLAFHEKNVHAAVLEDRGIDSLAMNQSFAEYHFSLDKVNGEYDQFLKRVDITRLQFETLINLLEAGDCEGLDVMSNGEISLRYDGVALYKFEYYITDADSIDRVDYVRLADGIYAGLYDSGLFCGRVIFDK
ncbi:MAG: hypothetical protein AAFZ63_08655 [Bacteroidota bacterium]